MILEPEDRRAARRAVAADAFERRGAELHRVREDVDVASSQGMNSPSRQIHVVGVSFANDR